MYLWSFLCLCIHLSFGSIFYIREKMWSLSFCTWFTLLNMISSSIHCSCIAHFLNPSSDIRHLDCFHSLTTVNSAAINMSVQIALLSPDLHFQIYAQK
jgi:hypothetical protein